MPSRRWLSSDAETLAPALIGCLLVHERPGERLVGRIVETEAYLSEGDPASHSARGPTARNASMFLAGGAAYVYRIYGLHHCFNVVSGRAGRGEAVLVRAVEPLEGLAAMAQRRGEVPPRRLCAGPANLVVAFEIGPRHDGCALDVGELRLERGPRSRLPAPIARGSRIGLTKGRELPLRFGLAGSPWLSRPFRPTGK